MRTTLDLNESLMKQLIKRSGSRTKTQALELAAREYLRLLDRRDLLAHFGKVEVQDLSADLRRLDRGR
jgi:Arc/MetJ family transcription regulator